MSGAIVDLRRRLMRDEIGRIAIELFVERGFDEVTVDDIAEAAGTSQRTFFRYFATKDEIVLDLVRRLHQRLLHVLVARPADEGAVTALRRAYSATSHVAPADRQRVRQLARVLTAAPVLRARAQGEHVSDAEGLLAPLAERMGLRHDDPRVRVLATAASAVASVEFFRWADEGRSADPSERIAAAFDMLEAGFAELDRIRPS